MLDGDKGDRPSDAAANIERATTEAEWERDIPSRPTLGEQQGFDVGCHFRGGAVAALERSRCAQAGGLSGDNGGSESEEGRRDNGFDKHDEE